MSDFFEQLRRITADHPDLRKHYGHVIQAAHRVKETNRESRRRKVGFSEHTKMLIDWALLRGETLNERGVKEFFKQVYDWEPLPYKEQGSGRSGGPRFSEGQHIVIDAAKFKKYKSHSHYDQEALQETVMAHDDEKGVITATHEEDPSLREESGPHSIRVDFQNSPSTTVIPHGQKSQRSGIYSFTPRKTTGTKIEFIYFSKQNKGKKPSEKEISSAAQSYVDRGDAQIPSYIRDEKREEVKERYKNPDWRHASYYSGAPTGLYEHKGDILFHAQVQQRGDYSAPAEGGDRTFNISDGDLYYLGRLKADRPSQRELEAAIGRWIHRSTF